MANLFWQGQAKGDGDYTCPWCNRDLKSKLSNSAKNPGKVFVSCSADFGGCGLFCFIDKVPDDKYKPKNNATSTTKRARPEAEGGTQLIGGIAALPNGSEKRLADLLAEVARLATLVERISTDLAKVAKFVAEATDN